MTVKSMITPKWILHHLVAESIALPASSDGKHCDSVPCAQVKLSMHRAVPDLWSTALLLVVRDVPLREGTGHRNTELHQRLGEIFGEIAAQEAPQGSLLLKDLFNVRPWPALSHAPELLRHFHRHEHLPAGSR